MLRLTPSKIEMSHRDITWHRQRFDKRKIEHVALARRLQLRPPQASSSQNVADDAPYSTEPVTNRPDAFWAEVMETAMHPRVAIPAQNEKDPEYHEEIQQPGTASHQLSIRLPTSSKENEDEATEGRIEGCLPIRTRLHSFSSSSRCSRSGSKKLRKSGLGEPHASINTSGLDGIKDTTQNTTSQPSASKTSFEECRSSAVIPSISPIQGPAERLRSRSIQLPRSPLHLAEAAASSSPRRGGLSTPPAAVKSAETPAGLLSLPPRRRRNGASEDSMLFNNEGVYELQRSGGLRGGNQDTSGGTSSPEREALEDMSPISDLEVRSIIRSASRSLDFEHNIGSESNGRRFHHHHSSVSGRMTGSPSTSSPILPPLFRGRRVTPFISTGGLFNEPPSSPPPIERSRHLRLDRESIRLSSDSIPPQLVSQSEADDDVDSLSGRPSTPQGFSSGTAIETPIQPSRTPRTPGRSMRVYDDSLPSISQPQTPIGLPRNGVPPMSIAGSFTAPQPRSRISRRLAPDLPRLTGLPNGRLIGLDYWSLFRDLESRADQENAAEDGTREPDTGQRGPRRRAASGNAREILDVTPPQEGRRG